MTAVKGFRNSEIQSAGQIQELGVKYDFEVQTLQDLSRQIVRSEWSTVSVPALELDIPPKRGNMTTIEGILRSVLDDLSADQPSRREADPESFAKLEVFIQKGHKLATGETLPFTVTLEDPSGNSWIELSPEDPPPKWRRRTFKRTAAHNEALSLTDTSDAATQPMAATAEADDIHPDEVHTFIDGCPGCSRPCETHMKMVHIPHFQEVIIMSTACDACGYRSNDVKTGGEIGEFGKKIILNVKDSEDLSRDILKSDYMLVTCT